MNIFFSSETDIDVEIIDWYNDSRVIGFSIPTTDGDYLYGLELYNDSDTEYISEKVYNYITQQSVLDKNTINIETIIDGVKYLTIWGTNVEIDSVDNTKLVDIWIKSIEKI